MFKLEREMPFFLQHNELMIKKGSYLFKLNKGNIGTFYAPAYLTTTENINGYYDHMDFEGKSVLTVIGASDQIFNAILRGASKVDGFDVSIYAIMFYYLKEATLKALNYEEFINFLYDLKNQFNKKTYQKLIPYIDKRALSFWNLIFSQKEPVRIITSSQFCFRNYISQINSLKKISSFLDKNNFYILKKRIKTCPVRIFLREVKFLDDIDGFYDYIILSNIIDYVDKDEFNQAISRYVNKLNFFIKIINYVYQVSSDFPGYTVEPIESITSAVTGEVATCNYILIKKRTL